MILLPVKFLEIVMLFVGKREDCVIVAETKLASMGETKIDRDWSIRVGGIDEELK